VTHRPGPRRPQPGPAPGVATAPVGAAPARGPAAAPVTCGIITRAVTESESEPLASSVVRHWQTWNTNNRLTETAGCPGPAAAVSKPPGPRTGSDAADHHESSDATDVQVHPSPTQLILPGPRRLSTSASDWVEQGRGRGTGRVELDNRHCHGGRCRARAASVTVTRRQ
jgi:hypothetical protein